MMSRAVWFFTARLQTAAAAAATRLVAGTGELPLRYHCAPRRRRAAERPRGRTIGGPKNGKTCSTVEAPIFQCLPLSCEIEE